MSRCLDFGSGYNPIENYLSCDITGAPYLDYLFDVEKYRIIGVDDNYFDKIYCRNVIHHIPDLKKLFIEFQRVLKIDGELIIIEPKKEYYKPNLILDIIWYRYIIPRYEIWFSTNYRDYVKILLTFNFQKIKNTEVEEKEYYYFRRVDKNGMSI